MEPKRVYYRIKAKSGSTVLFVEKFTPKGAIMVLDKTKAAKYSKLAAEDMVVALQRGRVRYSLSIEPIEEN